MSDNRYVKLPDGRVGFLHSTDSNRPSGKYYLSIKGDPGCTFHPVAESITETEYNETSVVKQPVKKGKKS